MGVFVLPGIEFQAAFDQQRAALAHVLGDDFRLAAPGFDVNKTDFFLGLAGFGFPGAVDRQADLGDGRSLGRVAQFRIARQVAR